ncbi:MAG TPA: cation diffusion facilitator family transporter [Rubrobacteraceae bacterium]|nr:cation diffusion facilitator family transporter [Rubrobacteraceae bacterium]
MKRSRSHPAGHQHETGRWAKVWHTLSHLIPFGHSHESSESVDDALESSKAGIRALKISLVALMLTALMQAGVVVLSGSVALLADTIHNFSDALTALPLWLAFALSRRATNRRYTYGYGRAEDIAGLAIVGFIFFSACVAGYESVIRLISGSEVSNLGWVAVAAGIGFVGNEFVAQFRIGVGRRIGSAALVADGQHARVDGFTSLAVLLGAAGVALGYPVLDPLIGLLITVAILFIVKDSARSVWRRMMDAVEPEIVSGIEEAAASTEGVEKVESVRARWVGHRIHSEVRIRVDGGLSVDEGEEISGRVRDAVRRATPRLDRVAVEIGAL